MKAKRVLQKIQIRNRQRVINKQYEKEGLTDDVLKKQVELNKLKHELDISDSKNKLHKNYVQ